MLSDARKSRADLVYPDQSPSEAENGGISTGTRLTTQRLWQKRAFKKPGQTTTKAFWSAQEQ